MIGESIPIPAPRIEPVALEAASGAKTVAGLLFFLVAVMAFATLGMLTQGGSAEPDQPSPDSTAVGILFFVALIALVALRYVRGAGRATAAAKRAKAVPSSQWFLSGRLIVGADDEGTPRPDLGFKISRKLRRMLLAVPRATVVDATDR